MTSRRTTSVRAVAGGLALAVAAGACGGPDGIEGEVRSTTTGKDRPVAGDWVAVLDDDAARSWWELTAMDPPSPAELGYLDNPVRHGDVTQAGGVLVEVDDDGRFHLDAGGERIVCRMVRLSQADRLGGCARVDLPVSGKLRLTITRDGLTAKVDRG